MKQGTLLRARRDFNFYWGRGHTVRVKANDPFWVTNTEVAQSASGVICIARGRQALHYDYAFTPEMIAANFREIAHVR